MINHIERTDQIERIVKGAGLRGFGVLQTGIGELIFERVAIYLQPARENRLVFIANFKNNGGYAVLRAPVNADVDTTIAELLA